MTFQKKLILYIIFTISVPYIIDAQDHHIMAQGAGGSTHNSISLLYEYNICPLKTSWTRVLAGTGFGRFADEIDGSNNTSYNFIKLSGVTLIGKKNSFLELKYGPLLKFQSSNQITPHFSVGFRMYIKSFIFRFGNSSHEDIFVSIGLRF